MNSHAFTILQVSFRASRYYTQARSILSGDNLWLPTVPSSLTIICRSWTLVFLPTAAVRELNNLCALPRDAGACCFGYYCSLRFADLKNYDTISPNHHFCLQCPNARNDMDAVSRELLSLKLSLEALSGDSSKIKARSP